MNLSEIKAINQKIYVLDTEISRNAKLVFISTLVFCSLNEDFRNPQKMTQVIDFANSDNPISDLVDLAKKELKKIQLSEKTFNAVSDSLDLIYGVSTKLYKNRIELQNFVFDFVMNKLPSLSESDSLFFETLYMEVDKKAKNNDKGITLTPYFAAQIMTELAEIDYKNDVVIDIASGTGLFSILAYSIMSKQLEEDKTAGKINQDEYLKFKKKISTSILANDYDAKMVTLTLANFILKNLKTNLITNFDIFEMKKSDFEVDDGESKITLLPTKAILNPPYEDTYKPVEIILKTIELLKGNGINTVEKVVVIIPPQKFGQKKDVFYKILNYARLDYIVKMQNDLFSDSGQTPATSVFVFDLSREHKSSDKIRYFDFTDSGFVFLKDSGMVDKNSTHKTKKQALLSRIYSGDYFESSFVRNWSNFYEVSHDIELVDQIDPAQVKIDKEFADITFENATIKRMLFEKKKLLDAEKGVHIDKDGEFEKYIIDVLSEE